MVFNKEEFQLTEDPKSNVFLEFADVGIRSRQNSTDTIIEYIPKDIRLVDICSCYLLFEVSLKLSYTLYLEHYLFIVRSSGIVYIKLESDDYVKIKQ